MKNLFTQQSLCITLYSCFLFIYWRILKSYQMSLLFHRTKTDVRGSTICSNRQKSFHISWQTKVSKPQEPKLPPRQQPQGRPKLKVAPRRHSPRKIKVWILASKNPVFCFVIFWTYYISLFIHKNKTPDGKCSSEKKIQWFIYLFIIFNSYDANSLTNT